MSCFWVHTLCYWGLAVQVFMVSIVIIKMAHGSSPEKAPREIARPVPGGFAVDGWANRASCSRDSAHFDGSLVFLSCRVVKGGQVQLGSSLMRKLTVRSMVEIPGRSLWHLSEKRPRIYHLSTFFKLFNRPLSSISELKCVPLAKQGTAPRILCYVFSGRLDVIHNAVGSRAGSSGHGGEALTARSAAAWDARLGCTVTEAYTALHMWSYMHA